MEPSDLAFLQFTSGYSSEPKGVMLSHQITISLKADDDTIVVSWLPQYHDMGLIGSYLGISYCGGSYYYLSLLIFLQCPVMWIEASSKFRGTHMQALNFTSKLTVRKFDASRYTKETLDLSALKHTINAAETLTE
jgi:acyl-CoA synthetase (AMP-forming)/AMP-acid ligase II